MQNASPVVIEIDKSNLPMLRRFVTTKCPYCGHIFTAPDIEDKATVLSMPVRCRSCGNTFRPSEMSSSFTDSVKKLLEIFKKA